MTDTPNKAYYAVIPALVRYDTELPANAKLLYGEISALCNENGYCWATNGYFAELYGVDDRSIQRWLLQLQNGGYIKITTKTNRRIYISFSDKNVTPDKIVTPTPTKLSPPPDKIVTHNNTSNNTDLIKEKEIHKEKELQDFNDFWKAYPRKTNKKYALQTWNKLQPDKKLAEEIITGVLKWQQTPQWKRDNGQFIPHASTFLNGERWKDELVGVREYKKEQDDTGIFGGSD